VTPEEDEALRRKEVDEGHRASRILEDSLFTETVEAVKDAIWKDFANCPAKDEKGLVIARLKLECLDDVIRSMKRYVETGKLAKQQLPFIDKRYSIAEQKRLKNIVRDKHNCLFHHRLDLEKCPPELISRNWIERAKRLIHKHDGRIAG